MLQRGVHTTRPSLRQLLYSVALIYYYVDCCVLPVLVLY